MDPTGGPVRLILMDNYPRDQHGIVYRRTALSVGWSDYLLNQGVKRGELTKIWAGAFAVGDHTPSELYRLRSIAASTLTEGNVLSHQSAASVHGLAMLLPDLSKVHTTSGAKAGKISARRHLHPGYLDASEVVVVDGVAVTSPARTAADVACGASDFAQALAVMDSALRNGVTADDIAEILDGTRAGVGIARRALAFADAGSENPGESWGRAQMICAGLPVPRLQQEFHGADGRFVARCDYTWCGRLVGEFDGMVKYQKYVRTGETPFDVVRREKAREDALRKLDVMVIRWVWDDLLTDRVVPLVADWLRRLGLSAA